MATTQRTFKLQTVNGGQAFPESAIPKVPARAAQAMFAAVLGSSEPLGSVAGLQAVFEATVQVVAYTLYRMDDSVTVEAIMRGEDYSEVQAVFEAIKRADPSLFVPMVDEAEAKAAGEGVQKEAGETEGGDA